MSCTKMKEHIGQCVEERDTEATDDTSSKVQNMISCTEDIVQRKIKVECFGASFVIKLQGVRIRNNTHQVVNVLEYPVLKENMLVMFF